ncbi:ribonuclease III [Gemella sp. GH3]|uniref:ribonuclease III n=1 Tax=unclassified Gemella TaxID=2624949 RepID=UPI0015CFE19A|nr:MULTISPECIES: ribonuclease III [unclassified Gemella]MBF0713402.1 ribonuclease III [Gemella sp. GH3.1]NYS50354.1 ribonuclease III [Gemella sp. GH3]
MKKLQNLLNTLNKEFNLDIAYKKEYIMAFTHSSYINENKKLSKNDNYERLEFLGDATLEIAISDYLYNKFPELSEGELTKIRASIVCEPTLVKYALQLKFNDYIFLGKGEEKIGGRERPALLADIFESFIGALYLDKGLEVVKMFLKDTLFAEIKDNTDFGFIDYKTDLQEYASKEKIGNISYHLIDDSGPSHNKIFTSCVTIDNNKFGTGTAKSKKESEQLAAKEALNRLKYFKEF